MEALPYIQRFRNQTFVIKYGGSFMDSEDPAVRDSVARDIVFLEAVGIKPVVVHGGGKAISRAMDEEKLETKFVQGMRMTDEKTVSVVERVLSNKINPHIVDTINSFGGMAKGFSGTRIFRCKKMLVNDPEHGGVDAGFIGEVTDLYTDPITECVSRNITPIVSPTATGEDGFIYNCNADVAAAKMAIALKASRLVFMSDVPGLMRDINDPASVISHLRTGEVEKLKNEGVIDKGMVPKIDSAVEAINSGVDKVSLVDGRVSHAVLLEIFTDEGVGTEVVL